VIVAEKAQPPVAKIIDFNKLKYQEQQKNKESKKKDKSRDTKEIRFTPFIAPKDFETRIERIKEFLKTGHKVRLTVKFTGRQITRKEFGQQLLQKALDQLSQFGQAAGEPKLQGKLLWVNFSPHPKKKK
jgi:translation initiation factor IF-3